MDISNIKEQEIRDDAEAMAYSISLDLGLGGADNTTVYELIYNYLYKKYDEDS